jgi:hypothetical protein
VHRAKCARQPAERPRYELGDIVRAHADAFRAHHAVSPEQARVLRALAACRTEALGGHLDRCLDCGHQRPAYNSCRNRHCPKCQALDQARWLAGRLETLLPVPYFHVVLTLPAELAPVVLRNRRRLFDLLFRAAAETLLTLGRDRHRLGAQIGITMVLHTWTRDLRFHPHVHAIVTAGGLSLDGERWIEGDPRYLVPVNVLSALLRGKMLGLLQDAHDREPLDLPEQLAADGAFRRLLAELYEKDWVTYAKPPFAGPEEVYAYLGRYTHRVGLSNRRLLEVTNESVTLRTRGEDTVTLSPEELLRRFLLHVLPPGFVKIRHYGLVASGNVKTKLAAARRLLGVTPPAPAHSSLPSVDWRALLGRLTGIDARICPLCASKRWVRAPLTPRSPARAPPGRLAA